MAVPESKLPAVATQTGWTREQVELVKRTVAKEATDDELKMFLYLASQYGLDPFKREIVFTKFQGRPSFITTRDGYLKIAMSDPDFDGLQAFVVREGDEFEIIAEEFRVHHKFGVKRGKIIGAWAAAYHKKRKPVICYVEFDEYYKSDWNTWKQYPSAMIQKVAEAFVLKRQFNISGLVTREEIGVDIDIPEFERVDNPQSMERPAEQPTEKVSQKTDFSWTRFWTVVKRDLKLSEDDIHALAGVNSLKDMRQDWLMAFLRLLEVVKNYNVPRDALAEDVKALGEFKNLSIEELNNYASALKLEYGGEANG
ncbi:MAG: recombinase RecT [Firmicutes bacterium]|nr:recombinase RecT [Bacillota bacterium]